MAGKKQRRMEQDPAAAERGKGKPKPKPGIKVNVDGIDVGEWGSAFKVDAEKAEKIRDQVEAEAQRIAKDYLWGAGPVKEGGEYPKISSGLFGSGPKASGGPAGGRIFIEGLEEFSRKFGQGFDASTIMSQLLKAYDVPQHPLGEDNVKEPEQSMASSILTIAVQLWDDPLDWQFMVGHNPGEMSYWFTAKFYDNDEGIVLAEGTVIITEEMVLRNTLDEAQLHIERQLADLQEKLVADLAAFEED
jgi:hypothetical protein